MRRTMTVPFAVSCLAALVAVAANAASVLPPDSDEELVPTGKGWGERPAPGTSNGNGQPQGQARTARPKSSNGISYHGGPVIKTPNVYYIWYGNWGSNTATTILPHFAASIGGSPYFNINKTYNDSSGSVTGAVGFSSTTNQTTVSSGYKTSLTDSDIQSIVVGAINASALPLDTGGVYFVLTSSDINESSGFCTQYCGWHTHANITGLGDIKYSFVGNPDRCPSACEAQTTSPNGNAGADGMASIIAHELEEATTDPDLNAWYDTRGYENADKCAWKFGTEFTASNGSKYNMTLNAKNYLIQQNWVNASGGYCALSAP